MSLYATAKNTMKPSKTVELSVMWANGSKLPEKISVDECKTTNFFQHSERISGFYGFHARGKGLQYCALDADTHGNKFFPVTLSVRLEKDISARMVTPTTLADVDMFNAARASRELIDSIAEFWYDRLTEKGWTESQLSKIDWRLTEKFMPTDESLVDELLEKPAFSHLRLFVYPALPITKPGAILTPISYGVTRKEYLVSATSPMYPDMEISI